jgi:hypothetical protein
MERSVDDHGHARAALERDDAEVDEGFVGGFDGLDPDDAVDVHDRRDALGPGRAALGG